MDYNLVALVVSVLTFIVTFFGTYIAYRGYIEKKCITREKSKCKHSKSNRHVLAKLSVAFTFKVTKD